MILCFVMEKRHIKDDIIIIIIIWRYSPLLSRLTALLSHVILNKWLQPFIAHFQYPPKWCTYCTIWLLHGWSCVKVIFTAESSPFPSYFHSKITCSLFYPAFTLYLFCVLLLLIPCRPSPLVHMRNMHSQGHQSVPGCWTVNTCCPHCDHILTSETVNCVMLCPLLFLPDEGLHAVEAAVCCCSLLCPVCGAKHAAVTHPSTDHTSLWFSRASAQAVRHLPTPLIQDSQAQMLDPALSQETFTSITVAPLPVPTFSAFF